MNGEREVEVAPTALRVLVVGLLLHLRLDLVCSAVETTGKGLKG